MDDMQITKSRLSDQHQANFPLLASPSPWSIPARCSRHSPKNDTNETFLTPAESRGTPHLALPQYEAVGVE